MSAKTIPAHQWAAPLSSERPPQLYRTRNINLAACMLALKKLTLAGVEKSETNHAEICFLDPKNIGPGIERDYITRNLAVDARTMVDHRALLLGEVKRIEAGE